MNSTNYFTEEYFTVRKSLMLVAAAGLLTIPATAMSAQVSPCQSCHQVDKDGVGPSWKLVAQAYGDAKSLAAVFKWGFKVEDRRVAQSIAKWKKVTSTCTGQYDNLIKRGGHEEAAAHYLFEVVRQGRFF